MPLLPNQDDVLHRSGVAGVDVNCINSLPDEIDVATSGDATRITTDYGTRIGESTTSGDTASLRALKTTSLNDFSTAISVFDLWVLDSPVTDDVGFGTIDLGGVSGGQGTYFDFTSAEYRVGATTAAATRPGEYVSTRIIIEQDFKNGETTFSQINKLTTESVTIPESDSYDQNIVAYESNGGGKKMPSLIRFKRVFVP